MRLKLGGVYGKFEDWLSEIARDLDCDGIYSSHDLMKAFIAGSETNSEKCKKCELLNELYDQAPETDRNYWIWTELFVMLHDGDSCDYENKEKKAEQMAIKFFHKSDAFFWELKEDIKELL